MPVIKRLVSSAFPPACRSNMPIFRRPDRCCQTALSLSYQNRCAAQSVQLSATVKSEIFSKLTNAVDDNVCAFMKSLVLPPRSKLFDQALLRHTSTISATFKSCARRYFLCHRAIQLVLRQLSECRTLRLRVNVRRNDRVVTTALAVIDIWLHGDDDLGFGGAIFRSISLT